MDEHQLPKYVVNANRILEFLDSQENKTWDRTQKELAEAIGISLAELSAILKTLQETGKIKKGAPLIGHRGKTFTVHLVDATPFDRPVRRELNRQTQDRPLEPGEAVAGVVDLSSITLDQLGAAVLRTLKNAWENEERYTQVRSEQMGRVREYREQLTEERTLRMRLAQEKEELARQVEERDYELNQIRGELNKFLSKSHTKDGGSFPLKDLLDEEELNMLDSLMRSKPGYYRESDREVGLAAS